MFEQVPVPTPFQVGPVNAYLADRTLVDPGPDSDEAWSALTDALAERDLAPGDIERLLITHPHPDHFGLASRFRGRGASVVAHPDAAAIMADFPGRLDAEQAYFREFFERCGMAPSTADTVTELPGAFVHYAPSVTVDSEVSAGETVTVDGRDLRVDDLVGHASGEVLFAFDGPAGREAIVGDNVLAEITPNPFLQPPPEPDAERPRVLPAYNDSLATLHDAGYDRMHPGHRGRIDDPPGRIDDILAEHDERTERVAGMLDEPTTPVEVMNELFGDLPVTEQFPGMSEAVGHLDVLEAAERVTVIEADDAIRYERDE
ncbi:MBL fold metallo-hydrolase [Halosimplex aquaticum]|uniref:MBL fold metallo-hydrolase n=1 Tax=Halosimplex aquaticum TaxID=3026162 RepID=A0ABD5XYA5_9EURY|nr:MBL fold metallo-hydrolase [Halosimplex aquaticum]